MRWICGGVVYTILVTLITILGFQGTPLDFVVDAEYITALLTAASILFGFWFALLGRKIEELGQLIIFRVYLRRVVILCLIWLAASVIAVFLAALNKIPSVVALWMSFVAFFNILASSVFTLWEVIVYY